MRKLAGGAALIALFAVCPLQGLADQLTSTAHPGDKLGISVYNHPDLSSQPVLDGMGRVSLPLIGSVAAQGLTPSELALRIQTALRRYIVDPAVDVQILSPGSSIFMAGPISGVFVYAPGETLVNALAQAQASQSVPPALAPSVGGQAQTSSPFIDLRTLRESGIDLRSVVIRRDGQELPPVNVEELVETGQSGPTLVPGDVISLRERPIAVKVNGVVSHPMTAHLYPDEPLRDALRQAGGVEEATAEYSYILKRDGQTQKINHVSPELSEPAQVGDEIVIPEAPRVIVAGQVTRGGAVAVQGDHSLLNALYEAGGPQNNGDLTRITVIHNGQARKYNLTRLKDGVASENPVLADGDSVFVPASGHTDFGTIFGALFALRAL